MTPHHIIFETERLIVRQYVFETDADNFFLLNGNAEVMRYIRAVKTKEECDDFLKQIIEAYKINPQMGRWAAFEKASGKFAGSFAIIPIEGTLDTQLGYSLLKENWGKGFASELTKGGLEFYFNTSHEDHIYGIAEQENLASHKVLLKNGFVPDGTKTEGAKSLLKFIYIKTN